jgi:hypothetical protein
MAEACKTMLESVDVSQGLAKLKIKASTLKTAVERSFFAFAACTPNFPRNFPGIASWANGICGMADELASEGWRFSTERGQPLIINGDESVAITVATGDGNTGINGSKQPCTKAGKGKTTVEAVIANTFLFPEMEKDAKAKIEQFQKRSLWILLMHRNIAAGKVYCELSRPITMEYKKGKRQIKRRIIGWSERIILEPVDFEATATAITHSEQQESEVKSAEITVEFKRRS